MAGEDEIFDETKVSQEILEKFPKINPKYLKLEKNASEGLITGVVNSLNQFLDETVDAEEARIAEEAAKLAKEEAERKALAEKQAKAKREYDIENDVEWQEVKGIEGFRVYLSKDEIPYSYAYNYGVNVKNGSLTGLTDERSYRSAKNDVSNKIVSLGLTQNENFEVIYVLYYATSNFFSGYKISDKKSTNVEYVSSSTKGKFAIFVPAAVKRSVKKEEKRGVFNFLKKIIFSS